ncbi:MAG: hypothetical protein MI920_18750 [Kiloniellales bacterium]|nr:hypothetical protein [Kiloniellales bacterium]
MQTNEKGAAPVVGYSRRDLVAFLNQGPAAIAAAISTLKRQCADPRFEHKRAMYARKATQLAELANASGAVETAVKADTAPVEETANA